MASVLVTGASGFIGSALVPHLTARGHDVVAASRAMGDVAEASTWTAFPRTDVVVHLAGRSFVPDSWDRPGEFLRGNLSGALGALDYCRRHGARLVFMSSYLYGHPTTLPIEESAALVPTNPYALSKKMSEDACRFFADAFALDVTVLRPFNVFGSGQSEPFLIPFILRQIREGIAIHVKDLTPRRDYVYVDDLAAAIGLAIGPRRGFSVFNIGSGVSWSVAELIEIIQKTWGTTLPVSSDDEHRRDEIMDTVADVQHARRVLGWTPAFGLRGGLEDMRRRRQLSDS